MTLLTRVRGTALVFAWYCLLMCAYGRCGVIEVVIYHTTDLHGNYEPVTDYEGVTNVGGLYQLAAVLAERRSGHKYSFLVDNGDTFQGTLMSWLTKGRVVIETLNTLGYDVWNLGNHDFDWGLEVLGMNVQGFSNAVLGANVQWAGTGSSPLGVVQPYVLREVGGVRIAFVGVTHPKIPYWLRPVTIGNAAIEEPATALLRVMPAVRAERPDCIVLLAHLGYDEKVGALEEELARVVELFPDIDVIIGGHTHTAVPSMKLGRTLFTQAGYHGAMLGEVRLQFDEETRELVRSTALVIPVGPGGAREEKVWRQAAWARVATEMIATQGLAYVDGVIGGASANTEETTEQTLICEAIQRATGAEIVFHGAFGTGAMVSNRVMTVKDLFQMIPYENGIVVAELNGREVREILDTMLEWWGTPRFTFPYGLKARVDVEGLAGERVVALHDRRGKALEEGRRYRVAFNSYVAASGGKRHMRVRALVDQRVLEERAAGATRDAVAMLLVSTGVYTPRVVRCVEVIEPQPGRFAPVTSATVLSPGALKLVEFAYMHPGTRREEQASEWFVVRNTGEVALNLKGYTFSDGDEGGSFRINKDLVLAPGEILVMCHSVAQFRKHPYAANPYLRLFEYGGLAGRLNLGNRGDELMILDHEGRLVDQVTYGQHIEHWPHWPAESKAPNHKAGESLVKTPGGWVVNKEPLSQW